MDLQIQKSYYHEPSQSYLEEPFAKHFAEWINNILGIITLKKDILPKLCDYCTENNIKLSSPESLRLTLKQLKLAQCYMYTSYLYKELTGVETPFIPHDIISRAKWYFINIYKAGERLVFEGKLSGNNNPQYSHLIYKIFDFILEEDDEEKRLILQFIHLPTEGTLSKRNREWKLVLDKLKVKYPVINKPMPISANPPRCNATFYSSSKTSSS